MKTRIKNLCSFEDIFVPPGMCFDGDGGGGGGGGEAAGSDAGFGSDGSGDGTGSGADVAGGSASGGDASSSGSGVGGESTGNDGNAGADSGSVGGGGDTGAAVDNNYDAYDFGGMAGQNAQGTSAFSGMSSPSSAFTLSNVNKGLTMAAQVATLASFSNPISGALALTGLATNLSGLGAFSGMGSAAVAGQGQGPSDSGADFTLAGFGDSVPKNSPLVFKGLTVKTDTVGNVVSVEETGQEKEIDMLSGEATAQKPLDWLALVGAFVGVAQVLK